MSNGELAIARILYGAHQKFQQEKTYTDLKSGKYRFDFYLPDYCGGILIEYDGEQHW